MAIWVFANSAEAVNSEMMMVFPRHPFKEFGPYLVEGWVSTCKQWILHIRYEELYDSDICSRADFACVDVGIGMQCDIYDVGMTLETRHERTESTWKIIHRVLKTSTLHDELNSNDNAEIDNCRCIQINICLYFCDGIIECFNPFEKASQNIYFHDQTNREVTNLPTTPLLNI